MWDFDNPTELGEVFVRNFQNAGGLSSTLRVLILCPRRMQAVADDLRFRAVHECGFNWRELKAIERFHLVSVTDVAGKTEADFYALDGVGEKTVEGIKKVLARFGLLLASVNP